MRLCLSALDLDGDATATRSRRGAWMRRNVALAIGLSLLACACTAFAQEDAPLTLHAYANLIQIPALVLTPSHKRMPDVDPQQFVIRLNAGPRFRPTHVRLEGDDPLALDVLIDGNGDPAMLDGLENGLAALKPGTLHAEDRISLFAADCDVMYGSGSVPPIAEELQGAAKQILQKAKPSGRCENTAYLWNAMASVSQKLASLPGRRVLVVVTDGMNLAKAGRWAVLRDYLTSQGITIFALSTGGGRTGRLQEFEELSTLCEISGGITIKSSASGLPTALTRLIAMLRERYILDFPRPDDARPGKISIEVALANRHAFIRVAGVGVPVADPRILTNPNTVPSDPSLSPPVGTRSILTSH